MIDYVEYMDQVENNIKNYIAGHMSNARVVAYCLKTLSPYDMHLFKVIGYQVINGEQYWCVWDTWNEKRKTLGEGHYMMSHDDAFEMFNSECNGYFKSII